MRSVGDLLGFKRKAAPAKHSGGENGGVRFLAITNDDPFYTSLHSTATTCGWQMSRAKSVAQALDVLTVHRLPLVVYDGESFEEEWQLVLERFGAHPCKPCVLLVRRECDEYLLREVTQHGGFHVLAKSAGEEHWMRDLRFAWFWRTHGQG